MDLFSQIRCPPSGFVLRLGERKPVSEMKAQSGKFVSELVIKPSQQRDSLSLSVFLFSFCLLSSSLLSLLLPPFLLSPSFFPFLFFSFLLERELVR